MSINSMEQRGRRADESGNVLFLILIAVALFAALSYAVTQSSRSGGGDASKETNLVNSAQLTQYPAGIRTSIVRMIISGTSVDTLEFNDPSDFGSLTQQAYGVFHPSGGGAVYAKSPSDLMASGGQGTWVYSADYEIEGIGTGDAGTSAVGNDVIAFLPGVARALCRKINEELGISGGTDADGDGVPDGGVSAANIPDNTHNMTDANPGIPTDVDQINGAFIGQPFGCFDMTDGDGTPNNGAYIYYHVLVEQ